MEAHDFSRGSSHKKENYMNNFIVTTTISHPTEAIMRFLKKNWRIVIVGDLKTFLMKNTSN